MQAFYAFLILMGCLSFGAVLIKIFRINSSSKVVLARKKLVIIPLDGVVIETNQAFWPAIRDLLEANGIPASSINDQLLNLLTGMSSDELVGEISDRFGLQVGRRKLVEQFSEFLCTRLAEKTVPVKGFESFYKKLIDNGYLVAVRTGTPSRHLSILDKKFNLTKTFGNYLYSSERVEKFGDKLLLYIANELGVKHQNMIVLVKKRKDADVLSKKNIRTISINYKKTMNEDGLVLATFTSFDDLFDQIKSIL